MKRILSVILVLLLCFGICACGGSSDQNDDTVATGEIDFAGKNFVIVRAEKSDYQPLAAKIIKAVKNGTGAALKVKTDSEKESEVGEILIGDCNRKQSDAIYDIMLENGKGRKDDYAIAYIDGKIVINAMSDEALEKAVDKFVADFCSTGKMDASTKVVYNDNAEGKPEITLNGKSIARYKFVIPQYNVSYIVVKRVEQLVKAINEKGGYNVKVIRDGSSFSSEYEVVVDNCDREGVKTIDTHAIYNINNTGKKVFINGGRNYSTAYALDTIIKEFEAKSTLEMKTIEGEYVNDELDYKLIWTDEFDTFDKSVWTAQNRVEPWMGGWYGRQVFRANTEDTLKVENGKLYEIAHYDDDYFYGVYMTTSRSVLFTYGFTEISAKLADGDGLWHCFWVWDGDLPASKGNNEVLEFDIFECWSGAQYYGNVIHETMNGIANTDCLLNPETHSYVTIDGAYKGDDNDFWTGPKRQRDPDRLMSEQFHTFALLWDEEKAVFYRDGTITLEHNYVGTANEMLYSKPHYFLLTFSVGSNTSNIPDDTPDSDSRLSVTKKPVIGADYWTNGKNVFTVEYLQLFQKDGWYFERK